MLKVYVIHDKQEKRYLATTEESGYYFTPNISFSRFYIKKPSIEFIVPILIEAGQEYEPGRYEIQEVNITVVGKEQI